jgi:hypothetical protein
MLQANNVLVIFELTNRYVSPWYCSILALLVSDLEAPYSHLSEYPDLL